MIHETKGFELTKEVVRKYKYACRMLDNDYNHLGDFFVKDLENVVPTAKRIFGGRAQNGEINVYYIVNEIQVSAYAEEIFKIEPFISKDQQKQFKEAYNEHFAGKA